MTAAQKARVREVAREYEDSVPEALRSREAELDESRVCLHCGSNGVVRNGKRAGLIRFRCRSEGCGRSFNALSGTNMKNMRLRGRWELYEQCLRDRLPLHESAKRCGISYRTAFLWHHRFLASLDGSDKLNGVVEMDETYFRESCKGGRARSKRRKPRKCVLVTDGHPSYRAANRKLGHQHGSLNQRRGEWKRGSFHLNTVNNRHEAMKSICNRRHRGASTRYFDNYASWLMCSEFRTDKTHDPQLFQVESVLQTPINT